MTISSFNIFKDTTPSIHFMASSKNKVLCADKKHHAALRNGTFRSNPHHRDRIHYPMAKRNAANEYVYELGVDI